MTDKIKTCGTEKQTKNLYIDHQHDILKPKRHEKMEQHRVKNMPQKAGGTASKNAEKYFVNLPAG